MGPPCGEVESDQLQQPPDGERCRDCDQVDVPDLEHGDDDDDEQHPTARVDQGEQIVALVSDQDPACRIAEHGDRPPQAQSPEQQPRLFDVGWINPEEVRRRMAGRYA
jgi:hypothetical protein